MTHDENQPTGPSPDAPPPTGFTCDVVEADGHVALILGGELDIASAPALEARFAEAIAAGTSRVVIDLRGLEFVDSTGLRVLLAQGMHNGVADGELLVEFIPGPPVVQRVFELAGVADRLRFTSGG
jgi:anti-sigma B factor antagonist